MLYNEEKELSFDDLLKKGDPDSLKECKEWLEAEERKISAEKGRLAYEETFFEKKMDILKGGFAQLEADKKKLERERIAFETEKAVNKEYHSQAAYEDLAGTLFAGVNNYLGLKKRYKDLLKIFHPDNLFGDLELAQALSKEFQKRRDG